MDDSTDLNYDPLDMVIHGGQEVEALNDGLVFLDEDSRLIGGTKEVDIVKNQYKYGNLIP